MSSTDTTTITVDERLRELEDCPDESTVASHILQELIEEEVSGPQLDQALSDLLGFEVVAVVQKTAQRHAPIRTEQIRFGETGHVPLHVGAGHRFDAKSLAGASLCFRYF